jgi:hypothetical protein
MTVHTSIAVPARQRHTRFALLAAALVALAVVIVVAVALATGGHKSARSIRPASAPQAQNRSAATESIMALTPARLAARALGSGYALPVEHSDSMPASILASMSPKTRRYTEAVMALTFTQLKAGAAGSP